MNITYKLECEPEEMPFEGHFAYGNAVKQWIRDQLRAGNEWAWFCAKVTARIELPGGVVFEGVDCLGGCSYESESSFRADPYYEDLCDMAREDLIRNMREAIARGLAAQSVIAEVSK